MQILALISCIIYIAYNAVYFSLFKKVPKSLSETYYLYQEKYKRGWVFMAALIFMGMLLIPHLIEITNTKVQFLAFLCPLSIIFVGSAPCFKGITTDSIVHPIAAILAAVFGVAWIIFATSFWWILLIVFILGCLGAYFTKTIKTSYLFWGETILFVSVYLCAFLLKA